jgi:hypothetical protein
MRAIFCLSYTTIVQKVVPFGESCPGTHTGYRIFLSHGYFVSRSAGFLGSIFIILQNKSGFCNVRHFINDMTIRYVSQNVRVEYGWKF